MTVGAEVLGGEGVENGKNWRNERKWRFLAGVGVGK